MLRRPVQHLVLLALLAGLAACAGRAPSPASSRAAQEHGIFKIGKPYEIDGVWYYPANDLGYDQTGIASWYGKEFDGKYTADGEVFDLNALTAAHRTLALPTIVQVTNLENGRSLRLRVNDRGPYARGRIIDLSRRAAQLLGFEQQGTARVRVQVLAPETLAAQSQAQQGIALAAAAPAHAAPVATVAAQPLAPAPGPQLAAATVQPPPPPAPPEQVTIVPVKATHIYIQAGAFTVPGNAAKVKSRLEPLGAVIVSGTRVNGVDFYRVRLGPIGSVDAADKLLDRVIGTGFTQARIIVD